MANRKLEKKRAVPPPQAEIRRLKRRIKQLEAESAEWRQIAYAYAKVDFFRTNTPDELEAWAKEQQEAWEKNGGRIVGPTLPDVIKELRTELRLAGASKNGA